MSKHVPSVRGMNDVLPSDIGAWHFIESKVRQVMHQYGYAEMRTPLVEKTALFHRSIGEVTDIVEKEMYTFLDRKEESLSLRPEGTASCVRAALEHGMLQPGQSSKIWYQGPMFRYERPQKGRTRQFHQVGAEVYGVAGPEIEAELILLSARLWRLMGIEKLVQLEINTLGSTEDRDTYRAALVSYFNQHESDLDEDSQRRLKTNPLRILDSKNPAMADLISAAPNISEHLSEASANHFDTLQTLLSDTGIQPIVSPRLVRGLDYYSHTVFEWTTDKLGAQSAVCAGGRYDGLIEQLGGKATSGVGWAMGMERLVALVEMLESDDVLAEAPDIFLVVADDVTRGDSMVLAEWLRNELPDLSVQHQVAGGSIKSQFKRADKSGARFAVVCGKDELSAGELTLKRLREDPAVDLSANNLSANKKSIVTTELSVGSQQTAPRQQIVDTLRTSAIH